MINDYMNEICNQKREKQTNNIPPIRIEMIDSPYLKGYTKQELDMRRKSEILKYKPNLQSNQTNSLTQKEKFTLLVKGYNNNTNIISKKHAICPNKPTPSSNCDIPGPVIDIYSDETIPLYNFNNESSIRSYGIIPYEDTTPWYIIDSSDILYNISDGLTENYGNYNTCASIYFKNLYNTKNSTFYLVTPVALNIESFELVNINSTFTVKITNVKTSVFFNNTIVSTNDLNVENRYNLPRPIVDFESLKPIIFDVSTNEIFQIKKYIGIIKVKNLVLFSATGYYYDIKLSFQVNLESTSNTDVSFNINAITNITMPIDYKNNASIIDKSPTSGPFYNFYLSEKYYSIPDVFNISLNNITYNSVDLNYEFYDPKYVIIKAYNGTQIFNEQIFSNPIKNIITYNNLNSDMSYTFEIIPYDYSDIPGTIKRTDEFYTLSDVSNVIAIVNDSSSILIDFSNSDLSFVVIQARYGNTTIVGNKAWSKPLNKPILYNGLNTGLLYYFTVIPYNEKNIAGNSKLSNEIYTLSTVSNISLSTNDSSSIWIDFSNSDLSYVMIQANNGIVPYLSANIYITPFVKPLLYKGLQPDLSYSFVVTPYNNNNNAGISVDSNYYVYTWSYINNVNTKANDSSSVIIDYSGSNLNYVKVTAIDLSTNYQIINNIKYYSKPFIYNGLGGGVNYNFKLTPYNIIDISGITKTSNNMYTLSKINTYLLSSNNSSSVDIRLNHTDISYVYISAITDNNNIIGPRKYFSTSKYISNINFDGLNVNNSYSITITPYNNLDASGITVITDKIYPMNTVSNIVLTNVDSSSINVYFEITDFSFTIIDAYKGGIIDSSQIYIKPNNIPYNYNYYGLLPDISYSFIVTPYNLLNTAGLSSLRTNIIYTLSSVSNIIVSNVNVNLVDLSFNCTDLSYVTIQAKVGDNPYLSFQKYSKPFINPITYVGLLPDVSYTFDVIPYNHANIAGNTVNNLTPIYTLSYVNNIKSFVNDSSSIWIDFSNSDLSYVKIRAIYGNSTTAGLIDKSYPFTTPILYDGLMPDISYTFFVTPYNHANVAGDVSGNSTAVYTWSYVNNVRTYVKDSSSVNIKIGNSDLSYVKIQAIYGNSVSARIQNIYPPFTDPIVYGGLLPDVSYTFFVTPYNHANVAGAVSGNNMAVYTWSYINNVRTSVKDSSSVNITFGNSDLSYVKIQAIYGNSVSAKIENFYPPFTNPIIYGGLLPDVSYTFAVTPYNIIDVSGAVSGNYTAVYTWSYVSNVRTSVKDASSVNIRFGNSDLSYVKIQAIYGNSVSARIQNIYPPFTDPIVYGGLLSDVSYTFDVTPYNHANVAGAVSGNSSAVYTWSYVYNVRTSVKDSSSINVDFSNSDISFVMINAIYGNSVTAGFINKSYPFQKPIVYGGLLPDVSYTFVVTPYNNIDVSGAISGNYTAVYTWSYVYNVRTSVKDTSSISIEFGNSDLSYVKIQAIYGNLVSARIQNIYPPFTNPIVYGGLLPDVSYTFVVTPYNNIDVSGAISGNYTAVYTWSYVNNVRTSVKDSSSVNIRFGNSDLSYVKIQAIYGNSVSARIQNIYPPFSDPIVYGGLFPDVSYTFNVTPFNHANVAGDICGNTTAIYTWSNVFNVITSVKDSSSISVDFSNSDISYVKIQAIYGNSVQARIQNIYPPFIKPIVYGGLIPDISYTFAVTPYNHIDVSGAVSVNSTAVYTWSYVYNVRTSVNDASSISITIGNSDLSYVKIRAIYGNSETARIQNIYPPFTNPIIYGGLLADVSYTFDVTPYNHIDVSGAVSGNYTAVYTWSTVNNVRTSVKDSSSVNIRFGNSDLSYVSIKAIYGNSVQARIQNIYPPFSDPIVYGGLLPDVSYTFAVTPYNHANVAGDVSGNTTAVYTWSYVSNVRISVKDSSSISVDFGNSDLSYVKIQAFYGNSTSARIQNIYKPFTPPITYGGLLPDISYTFEVTPYNNIDVSGAMSGNNTSVYTWSYVNNVKTFINDSSSITVDFSNSDISFVMINAVSPNSNNNVNNIYYKPLSTPILYKGLQPDISYTFFVTPYNDVNVAGNTVGNTTPVYTLSIINKVTLNIIYNNETNMQNIIINLDNYSDLSYVTVRDNDINIPIPYSKPISGSFLITFIPLRVFDYFFVLTPYNHANLPGNTYTTTTITI